MKGLIERLTEELTKLPGIGRKTAQRLSYFILAMPENEAKAIARAIIDVKEKAKFCNRCFNITEHELCNICSDPHRDRTRICVVEEPSNVQVIERTNQYRGLYHVLLGALSPIDGVTPDKLKIRELRERIAEGGVEEVIIATNPNTRGEMTAQYLKEILAPYGIMITRIAYGLPMGGDIEYADEVTLGKALEGRRTIS